LDPHFHRREEGDAEEREREETLRRQPATSSRGAMGGEGEVEERERGASNSRPLPGAPWGQRVRRWRERDRGRLQPATSSRGESGAREREEALCVGQRRGSHEGKGEGASSAVCG